jgi:hypothetical protein
MNPVLEPRDVSRRYGDGGGQVDAPSQVSLSLRRASWWL